MISSKLPFPDYRVLATAASHQLCSAEYQLFTSGSQLTSVVQAAVFSPPLQLLAVVVEALQAHDAVMQTDPGDDR